MKVKPFFTDGHTLFNVSLDIFFRGRLVLSQLIAARFLLLYTNCDKNFIIPTFEEVLNKSLVNTPF